MSEQLLVQWALALSFGYIFFIMYVLRHPSPVKTSLSVWPEVCILVPFRNEQDNLDACCRALQDLDYPQDKLQILMLNDDSADRSAEVVKKYLSATIRLINITSQTDQLRGKMNVLAQGIKQTDAEYLFVTDADCQPDPGWLKTMLGYFDDNTALVSGFTLIRSGNQQDEKLFVKLQQIDWIFLQGLAYGASNIGRPITVIGNNIAFKKSVYDRIGGFAKIGFSITEDHALMQAILDQTGYQVRYICDSDGPVFSYPLADFTGFIRQRRRWSRGGLKGRPFAFILVGFSFIVHLIIPLIFIFGPYNLIAATAIGLILGIDYFQLKRLLKTFQREDLRRQFVKYEVFYILYTIILFVLLPVPLKVEWKGRKY